MFLNTRDKRLNAKNKNIIILCICLLKSINTIPK